MLSMTECRIISSSSCLLTILMIHYELVFVVMSDLLFRILLLESNSFPISIILKQEDRFFFFFLNRTGNARRIYRSMFLVRCY